MKKIIACVIIVILVISTITTNADAIEYSDIKSDELEKAFDILYAYNIFKGYPDGTFRPSNLVTRAEMAKIVVMLIGYGDYVEELTSTFTDMEGHWAEKYVYLLAELNILRGYEDNTYRPNSFVSVKDAVTVMLRVLGYDQNLLSKDSKLNFNMEFAENIGLLNGVYNQSDNITRENIFRIVYNSLSLKKVLVKDDTIIKTEVMMMDNLGRVETEKITADLRDKHKEYDLSSNLLNIGSVYYNKSGEIVLVRDLKYTNIRGNVVSSADSQVVIVRDTYGNNNLYDLKDVEIIFNGVKSNFSASDLKNSEVTILVNPEDKSIPMGLVATKVTDKQIVMKKDEYKDGNTTFMGKKLPVKNGFVSFDNITVIGAANHISEIKENDVLYFYETLEENANSLLKIDVVRKTVNGIYNGIVEIYYQKYYMIGTDRYPISDAYMSTEELSIGDKIVGYLDKTGSIVGEDVVSFAKAPETYAIVYSVKDGLKDGKFPTIGIMNQYGIYKTYSLKDNCGVVIKTLIDDKTVYTTSLKAGDVIKYDKFDDSSIKICKNISTVYIGGRFNILNGKLLDYGGIINSQTAIVVIKNGSYKAISYNELGDNLKGRGFMNSNGVVEFILLSENNFTIPEESGDGKDDGSTDKPEIPAITTFTGSEIGVIKKVTDTNGIIKATLFDNSREYTVGDNININNYNNKLVMINVVNDVITSINSFSPEISKCIVTEVFKDQIQIDNISYVEYSPYVRVFKCVKDSQGNITDFRSVSIDDIVKGIRIDLYNINNNYSGVMDVIIIN